MENNEEIIEINEINKEERGADEAGFIVPELLLDKPTDLLFKVQFKK